MGKRAVLKLNPAERISLARLAQRGDNWRVRQRAQTLIYLHDGISMSAAAELLGVHVRTVGSTRIAWLDCGEASLHDSPRCGAPHKLGEQELQRIVALAGATPLSATGLLALHIEAGGQPVHVATLTAALKAAGMVWKRTRSSLKKKG